MVRVATTQPENQNFVTVCRLLGPDGTVITSSNATEVKYTVYDLDAALSGTPVKAETALGAVGDALTSALTVDGYWPYDSTGYNFLHTLTNTDISGSFTQRGGHTYEVVYKVTTTAFGVLYIQSLFTVTSS